MRVRWNRPLRPGLRAKRTLRLYLLHPGWLFVLSRPRLDRDVSRDRGLLNCRFL